MRARTPIIPVIALLVCACAGLGPTPPLAATTSAAPAPSLPATAVPSPAASKAAPAPICLDAAPAWIGAAKHPKDGVPDPDGRVLVGQVHRFDPIVGQHIAPLLSMDADGSDVAQVFNCEVQRPRFSPDGSRIAFSLAMNDDTWQIATIGADGSDLRILTSTAGYAETPDWSPDGTWLIYATGPALCPAPPAPVCDSLDESLWRMNADGSDQRPVGFKPAAAWDYEPRLGPDGSEVTFARGTSEGNYRWTLMILDLASGEERWAKDDARDLEHPDWSPDGRFIVYNQTPSGPIERVPSDDPRAPAVVLAGVGFQGVYKPVYSVDGSAIVFGCGGKVCRMNADGSDVQVLLQVSGVEFNHFDWGPPVR